MIRKVAVALEHRFYIYNGELYTKLAFSYEYWESYLEYFSEVIIIARAKEIYELDESCVKVSGEKVTFISVPYYVGVKEFVVKLPTLLVMLRNVAISNNKFLLRSGNVSNLLWFWLIMNKKDYLREYPGNIYEGVTGYGGSSLLVRGLGYLLDFIAKIQAKHSLANSFVSLYCKKIYESKKPSYVFSSFNLDEIMVKKQDFNSGPIFKVVAVGRLEGEKGHEDLLESLASIRIKTKLIIIGDGTQKTTLENRAKKLSLDVDFLGVVTNRDLLFKTIMGADLYVIPSHTEGMPRSLLEAMAIGMPCIGTSVGGIPEVIPNQYLVPPKSPIKLGHLIEKIAKDTSVRGKMSEENLVFINSNYSKSAMNKQKVNFWRELFK
jgi:glycosyltransferase involved in cell wall biosynthesis